MRFSFDPEDGLVVVNVELKGPSGSAILRLALDTGATRTLISTALLTSIGYDPATACLESEVTKNACASSIVIGEERIVRSSTTL